MVAAIVEKGFCSYTDIVTGKLSIEDVFTMAHMCDWLQYREEYAYTVAKSRSGKG